MDHYGFLCSGCKFVLLTATIQLSVMALVPHVSFQAGPGGYRRECQHEGRNPQWESSLRGLGP